MTLSIPLPLVQEHEVLHEHLARVMRTPGEVGEAARAVAMLMHPHFVKEDRIAMPPLGLLPALARGDSVQDMVEVLPLTDQLEAELPTMLAEHRAIVGALEHLSQAATRAGDDDAVGFARALIRHAHTEEAVLYPAAILVGRTMRQRLAALPAPRPIGTDGKA